MVNAPAAARRSAPDGARVVRIGPWTFLLHRRAAIATAALLLAAGVLILVALGAGTNPISPDRLLAVLSGHATPADALIVGTLRMPRVLAGALVGLALGAAGALFQSVTRNPLGSPDVIGFDTGASTGALIAMLFLGGGVVPTAVGAVLGGAVTAVAILLLASRRGIAPLRLVLVGIGGGAFLVALNWWLIVRANVTDAQSASVWLVGNLAGRDWSRVGSLAPVVLAGLVLALLLSRGLGLSAFDDDRAASLGGRPGLTRIAAIAVGVLLASSAVATAGPVAFVALAAPQIARRLTGATGTNVLASALTGALLLVATDLAAREAFQPRQLPVGVLTGLVGGGYLAWLLGREWRKGRG